VKDPRLSQALRAVVGNSDREIIDIELLKATIKRGNQVLFVEFMVEVGHQLITDYNREETAALPKLSVSPDGAEGNRVKEAMKKLRLINKVFGLKGRLSDGPVSEEDTILIEEFRENCQAIIKAVHPNIKKEETIDRNFNEALGYVGVVFDLTRESVEKIKLAVISIKFNKAQCDKIGVLFNDLFDFKEANVGKVMEGDAEGDTRDGKILFERPLEILYAVTVRHITFMFSAFRHLRMLDMPYQEKLIKGFLACIIGEPSAGDNFQGWCCYRSSDATVVTEASFYEGIKLRVIEVAQAKQSKPI
jgi:hypothetical protein